MRNVVIAAAMVATTIASASAETRHIAKVGVWTAYAGTADNGKYICGMFVDGNRSGKSLHVKILQGDAGLRILSWKKGWNIPEGTKVPITLGFDKSTIGDGVGTGYRTPPKWRATLGDYVQVWVGDELMEEFLSGFQDSKQMWLHFGSGSEADWIIDMTGSREVGGVFAACAKKLLPSIGTQPETSGTQPFGNPSGTQPFGSDGFEPDRPKPQPAAPQRSPYWNPV